MNNQVKSLIIIALLVIPFFSLIANAAGQEKQVTITIPKPSLIAEPAYGEIIYPRLASPAFVTPGGSLYVVVAESVEPAKIIIDNGYGYSCECRFAEKGAHTYVATIPKDAPHGVYDLVVVTKKGNAIGEPHAVYVGTVSDFSKLMIVHVTDRHFGVINSNGRAAANYDLAADLVALGLPNNTIVIDTGDTADTARIIEYKESITTDYLLNKPIINIPGNHDHVGGSKNFEVYRGPFNFTLSIYGLYRIVGIDSGGDGYIDSGEAQWASTILAESKEPVKIVLFHHPHFAFVYNDIPHSFKAETWKDLVNILLSKKPNSNYPYVYSSWVKGNKEAFEQLVKGIFEAKDKVTLVLSGHIHLDSYAEVTKPDGTKIYYVVTTATGGSVRPGDYHGFRVIKVDPATGNVEILGDGQPWSRHASFNLEKVEADLVQTSKAVTTMLSVNDPNIIALMKKTIVALPVPKDWYGEKLGLYLKNLDHYKIRCTPLGCVLYAYTNKPPKLGEVYQATLFTAKDERPPSIKLLRMYPRKPVIGRQVVLNFKITDDAWGIEKITAILEYNGKKMTLIPAYTYGVARIVIPPTVKTKEAKLTIIAIDASGKEATKTIEIKFQPLQTTTKKTTTTTKTISTTSTTPLEQQAAQTTTTKKTTTISTTTTATQTTTTTTTSTTTSTTGTTSYSQPSPQQTTTTKTSTSNTTTLVVIAVVILALVAFAVIVAKGR